MAGPSQHAIGNFIRQPGFVLAVINFCVGLVWMAVILPLDAPDEPGHLQAIMQVRKQHILPEMHLQSATNTTREIIWPPRDPETVAYIRKVRQELPVNDHYLVIPYKSMQPPLYYVIAGLVAHVAPADPRTVLYIGRLVSVALQFYSSGNSIGSSSSRGTSLFLSMIRAQVFQRRIASS